MAARVVTRLTGERVIIQDDGSRPAMPDIRIEYAAKPAAYVEVVVDIGSSYAAMDAEISKGVQTLPSDRIWWVRLSGRSNLKKVRRELPTLLDVDAVDQRVAQRLAEMGVTVDGPGIPRPGEAGGIHLLPAGIKGSATPAWASFMEWLDAFLASSESADVRRKLETTNAAERHAFVGASFTTNGDAFFALHEEGRPELPASDPTLPPEITHLWVWAAHGIGRCLAWFPDTGWIDVIDHWATSNATSRDRCPVPNTSSVESEADPAQRQVTSLVAARNSQRSP
jgi:hypothetical protein